MTRDGLVQARGYFREAYESLDRAFDVLILDATVAVPPDPGPGPVTPPSQPAPSSQSGLVWSGEVVLDAMASQRDVDLEVGAYSRLYLGFEAVIPPDLAGERAEIYLVGVPGLTGYHHFVRTQHRAMCVGLNLPAPWLLNLADAHGAKVETQESRWSSLRWGQYSSAGPQVSRSLPDAQSPWWIPTNGASELTLQIGERKPPGKDSITRLPIGVRIKVAVWGMR